VLDNVQVVVIQGLDNLTDFGFFEAKGMCPKCRKVIDDVHKIYCDECNEEE